MRKRSHWILGAFLVVLATGFHGCGGNLNESELQCEEAAAHLARCCPDFPVEALDCHVNIGACSSTYPMLTVEESRCVVVTSCEQLRDAGGCERARLRTTHFGSRYPAVCK